MHGRFVTETWLLKIGSANFVPKPRVGIRKSKFQCFLPALETALTFPWSLFHCRKLRGNNLLNLWQLLSNDSNTRPSFRKNQWNLPRRPSRSWPDQQMQRRYGRPIVKWRWPRGSLVQRKEHCQPRRRFPRRNDEKDSKSPLHTRGTSEGHLGSEKNTTRIGTATGRRWKNWTVQARSPNCPWSSLNNRIL